MILAELIEDLGVGIYPPASRNIDAIDVAGLCLNSADAKPGFLFAALPGSKTHGIKFLPQALQSGIAAVLTDRKTDAAIAEMVKQNITVLISDEPRAAIAKMAARFYAPAPRMIAAITGTNGKTSGTVFTRQIWQKLGHNAASIGTIGIITDRAAEYSPLTTPDAVALHQCLQKLANNGITHVAFEAGSHGLHQHRIDGIAADVAAFTNLTRDHLDYHGSMENYFAAKMILFSRILKTGGVAVVNRDIPQFPAIDDICRTRGARMISFGRTIADIQITALIPHSDHQIAEYRIFGKSYRVKLPVIGAFQAENIACAIGMAIASGENIDAILPTLETLHGVPGRMQWVARTPKGGEVYVDYAHTPDAIENVLKSLRPHTNKNLHIVFGCGGDRDPGKRPMMGEIASRLADRAIVTDDNPRSEDPQKIRAQILNTAPGAIEIGNRRDAILESMRRLMPGDILVIAGKGHEQGQIIGSVTEPFDDAKVAREAAALLEQEAA